MSYTIHVNGTEHHVEAEGDTPLLWVLRDILDLTGTKYGCGIGQCGACTVHANGAAARSCQMRLDAGGNLSITTIEGIGGTEKGKRVPEQWRALGVPRVGTCHGGRIHGAAGRS